MDNAAALRFFDRELALHGEHVPPGSSFTRASVHCNAGLIRSWGLGQLAEVAAEVPALLDDAWARNDMCIVPFVAGHEGAALQAEGDSEAGIRSLRRGLGHRIMSAMGVFGRIARRGLGILLGGEEAAALVAEADASLQAGGVVDPPRFAYTYAPARPE